jgi:DUF4097 and DUF4098 domain-containing protein YvlB
MSRYEDMITDEEIRSLLNMQLLFGKTGDSLDETLLDMEAKRIFAVDVAVMPPLHRETELIKKLNSKFAAKAGLKWLFSGLLLVSAVAYLSQAGYKGQGDPTPRAIMPPVPEMHVSPVDTSEQKAENPGAAATYTPVDIQAKPPVTAFPSLYERPVTLNNEESNEAMDIPGPDKTGETPDNTLPSYGSSSGELYNRSHEKQKISVDTLFAGIKRLEVYSTVCNTNIDAQKVDHVSLKGELNIETKGLVAMRSDFRILYERTGDVLKVTVTNMGKHNSLIVGTLNYDGYLNFIVPENMDLVVKNSSGDINVKNLSSKVFELEARYGHIRITDIHSDAKLVSASGNMNVERLDGKINALSSYGYQSFKDVNGDLKTSCTSGNVTVDHLSGDLDLSAGYGNVSLNYIRGDVKILSSSGNITGIDIKAKQSKLSASYGNIKLENIISPLEIHSQSGAISLLAVTGNVVIHSSYGNQVLEGIQGDITSKSASGKVNINGSSGNIDISLGYGDADLEDCKGNIKVISTSGDIRGTNIELVDRMDLKASYGDIRMNLKNKAEDLSFDLATSYGNIKVNNGGSLKTKSNGSLLIEKGRIRITGMTSSGNQWFE